MSDNRLTYYRQKFEEILVKKQEPKCRIWNCEEVEDLTNQLCDSKRTFPRTNRSLKHFHVLEASQVKELRYIDPYNKTSLKVIAVEDLFEQLYWAWEQTGFAGWKPLHHKIREQRIYISVLVERLFLKLST